MRLNEGSKHDEKMLRFTFLFLNCRHVNNDPNFLLALFVPVFSVFLSPPDFLQLRVFVNYLNEQLNRYFLLLG